MRDTNRNWSCCIFNIPNSIELILIRIFACSSRLVVFSSSSQDYYNLSNKKCLKMFLLANSYDCLNCRKPTGNGRARQKTAKQAKIRQNSARGMNV